MYRSRRDHSGRKRSTQNRHKGRRPRVEPLEERRLLATYVVQTELDVIDLDDGVTSLREAIAVANAAPGADEIVFDFGHDGPTTILLEHGELDITKDLSITGDGPNLLTIEQHPGARIFNITESADVAITGMTLTGGSLGAIRSSSSGMLSIDHTVISGNRGGGITITTEGPLILSYSTISDNSGGDGISASSGMLSIDHSIISGNSGRGISATNGMLSIDHSIVSGNTDGGISNDGGDVNLSYCTISDNSEGSGVRAAQVTVDASTIAGNSAKYGAGISASGDVTITRSTISDNSATGGDGSGDGGGIRARGDVLVTNSTVSGNSADDVGGGISGSGNVTIVSSTIVDNSASSSKGVFSGEHLTIRNSIVAGEILSASPTYTIQYSLIGDNAGTNLDEAPIGMPDANGNLIGGTVHGIIDPMLDPLADNGGPTLTHALLTLSPAIDAGDPAAMAGLGGVPQFDERGQPFARVYGPRIDIGAFELQPESLLPGDFDNNGAVDNADLTLLMNNWGQPVPPTPAGWLGSPPTGPAVDNDELVLLLNNWGNTAGPGGGAAVRSDVAELVTPVATSAVYQASRDLRSIYDSALSGAVSSRRRPSIRGVSYLMAGMVPAYDRTPEILLSALPSDGATDRTAELIDKLVVREDTADDQVDTHHAAVDQAMEQSDYLSVVERRFPVPH